MKKIATMTFHWAANYGAVIQAYALQKFLKNQGYLTEIIDYVPLRVQIFSFLNRIKNKNFSEFRRGKNIREFRKCEMDLSKTHYISYEALLKCSNKYEAIICGSDQIWNISFTVGAEGKPTLSYYLDFAGEKTTKIAYAVSFGTNRVPDDYIEIAQSAAKKFNSISVREKSGIDIANQLGVKAKLVCDPTLLIERQEYENLLIGKKYKNEKVFPYILHSKQYICEAVANEAKVILGDQISITKPTFGVYEWLYNIKHAKIVITNSFHGLMMSLIFHTPFIVVPVERSEMNDRIFTILSFIDLENRVVNSIDKNQIDKLIRENIDWKQVDIQIKKIKNDSLEFLNYALRNIKSS